MSAKIVNSIKINMAALNTIVRKRPIFVAWLITNRCNLRCKFCNFWQREVIRERELTVKEFAAASKKLAKIGVRVVNFGGGEPFIRKNLPEIVAEIVKDHIVIINTNGTLVNEKNAKEIFAAGTDVVNVSIDFFSKEKHDFYRGEGTYERAIKALRILKDNRNRKSQKVAIQTILSPENIEELGKLIELSEKLGIDFAFNPYRPGNNHEVDFTIKEKVDRLQLYELRRRYPNFKITTSALEKTIEYINNGSIPNCGVGKYMFAIDAYGEINPCEGRVHLSIGNIKDMNVEDIKFGLARIYAQNNCNKCWARERSEIEPLYRFGGWEWLKYLLQSMKL